MSKITFRADEDLVERIEARDASKSEIMREALREYLDDSASGADRAGDAARDATTPDAGASHGRGEGQSADTLDGLLVERVDELVAERLAAWEARADERRRTRAQDVNVNLTLESDAPVRPTQADARRELASDGHDRPSDANETSSSPAGSDAPGAKETACGQCGESLSDDHVYCPNCGEKAARRVFCECGDEVRSDWGFCPGCGRRTPAADVLDQP
jgi:hypothetical protein